MKVIGGIQGTFDIWNLAVIPALLNNCETWTDISGDSITELENLQNLFIRVILQVPVSCPKAATCYETGFTLIKFKIMERNRIDEVLSEQALQGEFSGSGTNMAMGAVDYIVYGSVTKFGKKEKVIQEFALID